MIFDPIKMDGRAHGNQKNLHEGDLKTIQIAKLYGRITSGEGLGSHSFLLVPVSPPVHFEGVKNHIFSGRAISQQPPSDRVERLEQHMCAV